MLKLWVEASYNSGDWIFILVILIFTIATSLTAWSAHITCFTDPADDALCSPTPNASPPTNNADQIYCYVCELHVHSSSKHCRYCDKCVRKYKYYI